MGAPHPADRRSHLAASIKKARLMKPFVSLLPADTKIKFMQHARWSLPLAVLLSFMTLGSFFYMGLNLGIDFKGGTLIEIKTLDGPADIGKLRSDLNTLGFGDVQVQEFGAPDDILIRIERQPGGDQAQQQVVTDVQALFGDSVNYRRIEVVGPRVSGELSQAGIIAVVAALGAVLIYLWLRFEWHFAVGAVVTTIHDIVMTILMFSLLQLPFALSSIAAILTILGYSLNDTVVVYDRIRENMRKYKKMPMREVCDLSVNQTLSRTLLTSVTTLLALGALFVFGGEVIRTFTFTMIWGVVIGTYSSIFIGAPMLVFLGLRSRPGKEGDSEDGKTSDDDASEADDKDQG